MKAYTLCKYEGDCRFKHYRQLNYKRPKGGRPWYPICIFKGTCNQQLTVYRNKLSSEALRLATKEPSVVKKGRR